MAEFKLRDFDLVEQIGKELLLVEVSPNPKYAKNELTGKNERTGEIDGYIYEVLMKDKKYKSIRVAIKSNSPIMTQEELDSKEDVLVEFEDIQCNPYVFNNFISLSFRAESIKLKNNKMLR